jgi:hypothetical protein
VQHGGVELVKQPDRPRVAALLEQDRSAGPERGRRTGAMHEQWHAFLQHLTARGHRPHAELRIAELGPEAGIVGAANRGERPRSAALVSAPGEDPPRCAYVGGVIRSSVA